MVLAVWLKNGPAFRNLPGGYCQRFAMALAMVYEPGYVSFVAKNNTGQKTSKMV